MKLLIPVTTTIGSPNSFTKTQQHHEVDVAQRWNQGACQLCFLHAILRQSSWRGVLDKRWKCMHQLHHRHIHVVHLYTWYWWSYKQTCCVPMLAYTSVFVCVLAYYAYLNIRLTYTSNVVAYLVFAWRVFLDAWTHARLNCKELEVLSATWILGIKSWHQFGARWWICAASVVNIPGPILVVCCLEKTHAKLGRKWERPLFLWNVCVNINTSVWCAICFSGKVFITFNGLSR